MCGIAGILDRRRATAGARLAADVGRMAATMKHRGPDGEGVWADADAGIAFGHRRLAILDPTDLAAQPIHSADRRYVLTFNGEIYNFADLRQELEQRGSRIRSTGDTEVLVEAIAKWSPDGVLDRIDGMFAFAVWDRRERKLHLVRDRLGEKPLYYGWFGDTILFGSELKALEAHPAFCGDLDHTSVAEFLRHKYVPAPRSIYRQVRKLRPGSLVTIAGESRGEPPADRRYWTIPDVASGVSATPAALVDEARDVLSGAVQRQVVADVPVGAFLSGGIDSSLVVALMQAQASMRVRTFTVGFAEQGFDEADHADAIARHLGTDHVRVDLGPAEAMAVVPDLPTIYDEPFGDSSQIPTTLISRVARADVTVCLSGDGGDELFGGYHRHRLLPSIQNRAAWLPGPLRRVSSKALRYPRPSSWDRVATLVPATRRPRLLGDKVDKVGRVLSTEDPFAAYRLLTSHWEDPAEVLADPPAESAPDAVDRSGDLAADLMRLDAVTYLPDDILAKVDRAAMSVSLETRVPFLDRAVAEFAFSLPSSAHLRDGKSKWLLRQVLAEHVPARLSERPKAGFGVPVGAWMRGPLRGWAQDLLAPATLQAHGVLSPDVVRRTWDEHQSGRRDWTYRLWDLVVLQAWLEAHRTGGA